MPIFYLDRATGEKKIEKVYRGWVLSLVYENNFLSRFLYHYFLPLLTKFPFFSRLYGYLQKSKRSARKIAPFIKNYGVDTSEFLNFHFDSFNDFFIRKLKPEARPLSTAPAIIPADGRYFFYQNIDLAKEWTVKGKKFDLSKLLQSQSLAEQFAEGSLVIARLCPSDYHRFHFPCDCTPGKTKLINGWLYSVNPIALKRNLDTFMENKRTLCLLQTQDFHEVAYLEIGATNVGAIQQTYSPGLNYSKGAEKGYFEFGGSALVLLFKKNTIQLDIDLLRASQQGIEIKCLIGQSMGKKFFP